MAEEQIDLYSLNIDEAQALDAIDNLMATMEELSSAVENMAATASDLTVLDDALSTVADSADITSISVTDLSDAMQAMFSQMAEDTTFIDQLNERLATLEAQLAVLTADEASAEESTGMLASMLSTLKDTASTVGDALTAAMGPLMMIVGAAGMAGGALVKMGMDGQQSEALLRGMAGASQADITALQGAAVNLGLSMTDASAGLYEVESAGYAAGPALTVFTAATKLAEGGGARAADVMTGLTAIMHDYGAGADQATHYTDLMATAVVRGKQSMQDFATSIGPLASAGQNVGLSFNQIAAAEATMTQINPHVQQDSMQLAGLFQSLSPTMGKVVSAAKSLKLNFDLTHYSSLDLLGKLEYLSQISGGPTTAAFVKLTGGVRGSTAAIDLLKGGADAFKANLQAMGSSAGATQNAFDQFENTIPAHLDKVGASLSVFATKLMDALGPTLIPIIDKVTSAIGQMADLILNHTNEVMPVLGGLAAVIGSALVAAIAAFVISMGPVIAIILGIGVVVAGVIYIVQHWGDITDWLQQKWQSVVSALNGFMTGIRDTWNSAIANIESFWSNLWGNVTSKFNSAVSGVEGAINGVIGWFNKWKGPIEAVAGAITIFFLPALIKAGVQAVIQGAIITTNFVKSMIQTGIEAGRQGVIVTTQFVQSMIKTGTTAVTQGTIVTLNFIKSMIQTGIEAARQGAIVTIQFIGAMIKTGAQAIATAAIISAKFVWSLIQVGIEGWQSGIKLITGLIPAIVSFASSAIAAAATAIPAMITGFIAWTIGAWNAAAATIAATWPVLLIIAAIALLVVGIILLVQHWGQVTAFLRTAWQATVNGITVALHVLAAFFVAVWNGIVAVLRTVWNWIVTAAKVAFMILLAIIMGPILLIAILIYQHWAQIQAFLQNAWKAIVTMAQSLWSDVVSVFTGAWGNLSAAMQSLWNNMVSLVSSWPGQAMQWGTHLIQGLINGITGMLGNLGHTVQNVASTIAGFLHFTHPDIGPLADVETWMPHFGDILESGMQANVRRLGAASSSLAGSMAVPQQALSTSLVASGSGSVGGTSSTQTQVLLSQILAELQRGRQSGGATTTSLSQMVNVNGIPVSSSGIAQIMNMLFGLSIENGARGVRNGM